MIARAGTLTFRVSTANRWIRPIPLKNGRLTRQDDPIDRRVGKARNSDAISESANP